MVWGGLARRAPASEDRGTVWIRSRDELATSLEQRIVNGELLPGALLPSERLLSEEYGISRSMVREALRTLAERRLIDVVPGRGSFVHQATIEDSVDRLTDVFDQRQVTARHLIEARKMVETTAAWLAAERADDGERRAIEQALVAFDGSDRLLDRVRGDLAFHLAVVHGAGNPFVETMFRAIQPYTVELMLRSLSDEAVVAESVPYHRQILDGIHQRQPQVAADAMFAHLSVGLTAYGDDLDQNLDVVTRTSLSKLSGSGSNVSLDDLLRMSRDAS